LLQRFRVLGEAGTIAVVGVVVEEPKDTTDNCRLPAGYGLKVLLEYLQMRRHLRMSLAAALPQTKPVFTSANAPVQTDIVTSAPLAEAQIHSSIVAVSPFCAGMTTSLGEGAVGKVKSGTIFKPPLAATG
jgi:hypothetical protein